MKTSKPRLHANHATEKNQGGFTLIEMMIVLVIIGVLLAIAMPAYTSFVQKSYRTDAKTALLDLASREEKFFTANNQYTNDPTLLYGATASFPMNVQSSSTAYYQLIAPVVGAPSSTSVASFTAQAAPIAGTGQANDACGTFSISNTGTTSAAAATCW